MVCKKVTTSNMGLQSVFLEQQFRELKIRRIHKPHDFFCNGMIWNLKTRITDV